MPSQDVGSVPHEVGQLCDVCGSKSGVRLGARAACSAWDIRRAFSHALLVRAVDGRVHAYRERERERHGGRGRGGYTAAETVSDCGALYYCLSVNRDQVLIEARRSVQCVVCGFLETSAHKSHRYSLYKPLP